MVEDIEQIIVFLHGTFFLAKGPVPTKTRSADIFQSKHFFLSFAKLDPARRLPGPRCEFYKNRIFFFF